MNKLPPGTRLLRTTPGETTDSSMYSEGPTAEWTKPGHMATVIREHPEGTSEKNLLGYLVRTDAGFDIHYWRVGNFEVAQSVEEIDQAAAKAKAALAALLDSMKDS